MTLLYITLILIAYLCGSIASAVLICKLIGQPDPRLGGSGNPGATNMLRLHGKTLAIITLISDVLKGFIPVYLTRLIEAPDIVIALSGLATFLGHLFPIFFAWRGGKGAAILTGILAAIHWPLALAYMGTWISIFLILRYSSLASIIAALSGPFYTMLLLPKLSYLCINSIMYLVLIATHHKNIRNLLAGTEKPFTRKKTR